jgi:septum formation protein
VSPAPSLILACASPRVAALLRDAGFDFEVMPAHLESEMDVEETPDGYVRRLAVSAVQVVSGSAGDRPILAPATIVTLDGQLLTAPTTAAAATQRMRALAGRDHIVTTAVCLSCVSEGARRQHTSVERTIVTMAPMTSEEIDWYVRSGEADAAPGGYVIDKLASRFVVRLAGSPSNAAGLPLATLHQLWTQAGLPLL